MNCLEITNKEEFTSELGSENESSTQKSGAQPTDNLLSYIYRNIIGKDKILYGPFGPRKVVYADYTASGKSLAFIEKYIQEEVLSDYGNTHTTTNVVSLQTTLFRTEAKDIIRNAVNASDEDAVICVGSGCTGAIHKLIQVLDLPSRPPPVVFVGPFEHHSNLLPWRELAATIVRIPEDQNGQVDLEYLEVELAKWKKSDRDMMGCFVAASNVTGILTDTLSVAKLLHRYGALSFWDYATAAPYLNIDMNPVTDDDESTLGYKDAIVFSCHKFVGGVQTPGVLIAKKNLFRNDVPGACGGGTVFFVRRENHLYVKDIEAREEGGTPAIVESIRAGLVFQLKSAVSPEVIMNREEVLLARARDHWKSVPNLLILGSLDVERLPIFSFVIKHADSGLFLHSNFVCTLLNDLFGVQARGGCACAGPYAEDLLGISEDKAKVIEELLVNGTKNYSEREIFRPGFARLNLPYFMDDADINYILEAVSLVAEHGWKMLPFYMFNIETGEWAHQDDSLFHHRKWLGQIDYKQGIMNYPANYPEVPHEVSWQELLNINGAILKDTSKVLSLKVTDQSAMFPSDANALRSFLLPSEAILWLQDPDEAQRRHWPGTWHSPTTYPKLSAEDKHMTKSSRRVLDRAKSLRSQNSIRDVQERHMKFSGSIKHIILRGYSIAIGDKSQRTGSQDTSSLRQTPSSDSDGSVNSLCLTTAPYLSKGEAKEGQSTLSKRCLNKRQSSILNIQEPLTEPDGIWHPPPKNIFKPFLKGIRQFEMIKNNDNVMVALSGGEYSTTLLHALHQYQFYSKSKNLVFDLAAVVVDPKTDAFNPTPLKNYLASLGIKSFFKEQPKMNREESTGERMTSLSRFGARMTRGAIYQVARENGYNVVALGHRLDDVAESFMMCTFFNGVLGTVKANYTVSKGDLRVIRPFIFVRNKVIQQFAHKHKLPLIKESCLHGFERPKERQRIQRILTSLEETRPNLYKTLKSSLTPLIMGGERTKVINRKHHELGEESSPQGMCAQCEENKQSRRVESDIKHGELSEVGEEPQLHGVYTPYAENKQSHLVGSDLVCSKEHLVKCSIDEETSSTKSLVGSLTNEEAASYNPYNTKHHIHGEQAFTQVSSPEQPNVSFIPYNSTPHKALNIEEKAAEDKMHVASTGVTIPSLKHVIKRYQVSLPSIENPGWIDRLKRNIRKRKKQNWRRDDTH